MPIVLDPKEQDVPQYAPAVIKLFQELTKEFTEEKLKNDLFNGKENKENDAKAVVESLKKLASYRINPKGANIKISEYWQKSFEGHEEQGKKLFNKIKDKLKEVVKATEQDGIKKKEIDKKIEIAATNLLNELNAVLTAWGNVNTAVTEAERKTASPSPIAATAAQGTKEALAATLINLSNNDSNVKELNIVINGTFNPNDPNSLARAKGILNAAIKGKTKSGISTPPDPKKKKAAEKVLSMAGISLKNLQTLNELKKHKEYYKAGLITENEYLAFLVKTRKFITETNAAIATTPNSAKDKLGGLLAALAQDTGFMKNDYFKLVSELQVAAKSGAAAQVLSEQKKRLIKAKIKQRILSEGIDENGMINELAIFSALKGILGAVIGWIAGKFSNWFKGGPATVHVVPSNYVSNPNSQQVIASLIEQIAALESARQTPDGATVDQNNKPVDVNNVATAIESAKKSLEENKAKYANLQNEAKAINSEITAAYTAHPTVVSTLSIAINTVAPNPEPLAAALTEKENYLKS